MVFPTYTLTHFLTHSPGATESRHHFIGNQQRPVSPRDLRSATEPPRGLRNHSGCALNQGLEDECGVRISALLLRLKFLLELADTFPVALAILVRIGALRFGD